MPTDALLHNEGNMMVFSVFTKMAGLNCRIVTTPGVLILTTKMNSKDDNADATTTTK